MRISHLLLPLLLAACAAPVGPLVPGEAIEAVSVQVDRGVVRISAADQAAAVLAPEAPLGGSTLRAEVVDGVWEIEGRCDGLRPCALAAALTLPADLPVTVALTDGALAVDGTQAITARVVRGEVRAEGVEAIDLQVGIGAVQARALGGGPVSVLVGEGDVDLRVPGGAWDFEAIGASVEVDGIDPTPGAPRQLYVAAPGGAVHLASAGPFATR